MATNVKQRASSSYKSVTHSNSSNSTVSFGFLDHDDVSVVVDLGVVPGGWSRVAVFGARVKRRPADSSCGSDYNFLDIDTIEEELVRSESRTIVVVD
ncbi:uncharacterized protein ARMOST_10155 [Armillaria ostoyae]|uniref:Ribosomal RNA methyltransferase FtsJ domain-containing protein n=1 Tax=Armillaria ostoyae TaxID=47428 RepID=A0A284RDH7_ARMOS|nr:uncharacterized protein ARMOST_10155 [Armillaria ostoyae]